MELLMLLLRSLPRSSCCGLAAQMLPLLLHVSIMQGLQPAESAANKLL
jgi:hypothetical protein